MLMGPHSLRRVHGILGRCRSGGFLKALVVGAFLAGGEVVLTAVRAAGGGVGTTLAIDSTGLAVVVFGEMRSGAVFACSFTLAHLPGMSKLQAVSTLV